MQLGRRIDLRMQELGLTQGQLAQKSHITQQAISNYIRGKSKPSYDAVVALASALQVRPGWFFEAIQQERLKQLILTPKYAAADSISFPAPGKRTQKSIFVIGHWLPMQHRVPPIQAHSVGIITNFYGLLFNQLIQAIPPIQYRGSLATSWKLTDSGWLFMLRQGVYFHNDKPLTTDDVRWSYAQYLQSNPHERWIESIEIIDKNIIQLRHKHPCRLENIAMPFILPEGGGDPKSEWIGTGPFQVAELAPHFWRLCSNPHYFLSRPFFDEVHIREYSDPRALEEALVKGEVHFAIGVYHPGKAYIAKAEPAAQRYQIHFNMQESLVQNIYLRRAISLALDREALAKAAGLKEPLYSSGPFDYVMNDRSKNPPPKNLEKASKLLQKVPELKDTVFRVRYYNTDPRNQPVAEAIVEQLRHLGINSEIGDPAHAVLAIRGAETPELEYGMWTISDPRNISKYHNPVVDKFIQELQRSSASLSDLQELRRLIQKDIPDIPLFYLEMPLTYVKELGVLEDQAILVNCLNEIHTWNFNSDLKGEEVEMETEVSISSKR